MYRFILWALFCTATIAARCYADSARALLENDTLAVSLAADGSLTLTDKTTQVTWNVGRPRLIGSDDIDRPVEINGDIECTPDTIRYRAQDGSQITLQLVNNPASLDYSVVRSETTQAIHLVSRALAMLNDQVAKEQLCDYIRQQVGLFGSEEGSEWGVPHADYFEGLMSHRTRWQQPEDTSIILPLFELVFGDAIPLYTHQSDRPRIDMPEYILGHILYAEMPVYDFGNHRYYREATAESQSVDKNDAKTLYARGGRHCLVDQFIKNTYEVLSPLGRLTALMEMTNHQFLTHDRLVECTRFGTDVDIVVNFGSQNFTWQDTVIPPRGFAIDSPSLKAFCALRYAGVNYSEPTLFVLWARDGKSLEQSDDVRIYHGFGEPRVQFRQDILNVKTPETLVPTTEQ